MYYYYRVYQQKLDDFKIAIRFVKLVLASLYFWYINSMVPRSNRTFSSTKIFKIRRRNTVNKLKMACAQNL